MNVGDCRECRRRERCRRGRRTRRLPPHSRRNAWFDVAAFERAAGVPRVGSAVGIQANGRQVRDAPGLLDAFGAIRRCITARCTHRPAASSVSVDLGEVDIPFAGDALVLGRVLRETIDAGGSLGDAAARYLRRRLEPRASIRRA